VAAAAAGLARMYAALGTANAEHAALYQAMAIPSLKP